MLGYYTGKGLPWKWSEPLGRGGQSGGVHKTETNCESFPGYISDAGESPKRKHTTFSTRQKFEIKKRKWLFSIVCIVYILLVY